jgi:hypothetical protein
MWRLLSSLVIKDKGLGYFVLDSLFGGRAVAEFSINLPFECLTTDASFSRFPTLRSRVSVYFIFLHNLSTTLYDSDKMIMPIMGRVNIVINLKYDVCVCIYMYIYIYIYTVRINYTIICKTIFSQILNRNT